jgi:hypothetical protein
VRKVRRPKANKKSANKTLSNYKPKAVKAKNEEIKEYANHSDLKARLRQSKQVTTLNANVRNVAVLDVKLQHFQLGF